VLRGFAVGTTVGVPSKAINLDDMRHLLGRVVYFLGCGGVLSVSKGWVSGRSTRLVIRTLTTTNTLRATYQKRTVWVSSDTDHSQEEIELATYQALNSMGLDRISQAQYKRYVPYCEAPLLVLSAMDAITPLILAPTTDNRILPLYHCELFTAPAEYAEWETLHKLTSPWSTVTRSVHTLTNEDYPQRAKYGLEAWGVTSQPGLYADDVTPQQRQRCLQAGVMVRHKQYRTRVEHALLKQLE
jgi:hypothetical protein